jgi:hypothetical protein
MTQSLTNFTPEIWAENIQDTLDKTLVAKEICNTKYKSDLQYGDIVHVPYVGNVTANAYVDAVGVTINDVNPCDEYLTVNRQYDAAVYIPTKEIIQNKYSTAQIYQDRCSYALQDEIDTYILSLVTSAGITLDAGDLAGGSGSGSIAATTTNVIEIFAAARAALMGNNVKEAGDFIAVITPELASFIEQKSAVAGFSVADSTLRNGFAGSWLGWRIYVSNNIHNAASIDYCLFMKKGAISLVMQKEITVEVKDSYGTGGGAQLGKQYISWDLYGAKVFQDGAKEMVQVKIAA